MTAAAYSRTFLVLWVTVGLAGCLSVPIPPAENAARVSLAEWQWTDIDEISSLRDLYDYAEHVEELPTARRMQELRELDALGDDLRPPLARVRLAVLLGGVDPELTDYRRAGRELQAASMQVAGKPLLAHDIETRISYLRQLEQLQQALVKARKRRPRPRCECDGSASTDTGTDADESTSPAADQAVAVTGGVAEDLEADQDPDAESRYRNHLRRLRAELNSTREDLRVRDVTIGEQDRKIQALEAKIKALSAIERNLTQRTLDRAQDDDTQEPDDANE